ncbi:methionine adenosyltransferase 2 subunit beta-like isoform X2 [Oratosquilla oratoria]|uniref:methionine adenosyltransferase 2 subunit beta-like isoform X2 n=1 Tax=Oratosquilla oratoria TaxID=337810 RepID=UPI003F775FE4
MKSSGIVERNFGTMPKVLVTGASGLLGRAILALLKEENWNVVGLGYSRISQGLIKCDLRDREAVSALLKKEKPDFIIHCAAERAPDKVENHYEETVLLNVKATEYLASIAKELNSRLIYISTDYVFDGVNPPYKIDDKPNPLNKYGQSKLEGEKATMEVNPDACILRIPILYGPVERIDESAVTVLLNCIKDKKPITLSHYEKRYPVNVRDIAKILRDLIMKIDKDPSISGIFQWSGKERLTKYEMAMLIAEGLNLPFDHISPDDKAVSGASRPYNALMDNSRLEELGISHHTGFKEGIKACLEFLEYF